MNSPFSPFALPATPDAGGERRSFLKTALALAALPLCASAAQPSGTPTLAPLVVPPMLRQAAYDRRFAPAREFGRAMRRTGVPVHALDGDITALWVDQLDPLWRRERASIAGLTTERALFCLEQMAAGHQMRVLQRHTVMHRSDDGTAEALVSWVIGPIAHALASPLPATIVG